VLLQFSEVMVGSAPHMRDAGHAPQNGSHAPRHNVLPRPCRPPPCTFLAPACTVRGNIEPQSGNHGAAARCVEGRVLRSVKAGSGAASPRSGSAVEGGSVVA